MIFDLERLPTTTIPQKIYCSTGEWIISKYRGNIQCGDCHGNVFNAISFLVDDSKNEYTELPDSLVFVFAGKWIVIVSKKDGTLKGHFLDSSRIGTCITALGSIESELVFGTRFLERTQLVRYNPDTEVRVCQTSSWNLDNITDFLMDGTKAYVVLNHSMVIEVDMATGKNISNRFEANLIGKRLCLYQKHLIYPVNGLITEIGNQVNRVFTPRSIEILAGAIDNNIIYLNDQSRTLGNFNLFSKKLQWEVPSNGIIREVLFAKAKVENKIFDIIIIRLDNQVVFVRVQDGSIARVVDCGKTTGMRITGANLVVDCRTNTLIVSGEKE